MSGNSGSTKSSATDPHERLRSHTRRTTPARAAARPLAGRRRADRPFAKEIFLIETHIAGTSHVPIREIEPTLATGASLVLRREPDNRHDNLAILILTEHGGKLGYVPRDRNEILARLMDAGKFLIARLEDKQWHGDWLRVSARVFLRDV